MSNELRSRCALLSLLLMAASPAVGQTPSADPAPWWAGRVSPGEPGGAMVVRRWGREVLAEARGSADLASGRAIDATTPFYIASVAKPITASAIRVLAGRGTLDLSAPVGAVFPEIPTLATVRARHLLDQTAGVPDYFQWIDWPRFRRIDDQGVIDTLAAHPALVSVPGERFGYSNSHYVLLSELVRRATGVPLAEVLQEEYGAPLGLASLYIDDSDDPLPADAANGYSPAAEGGGFSLSAYEAIDLPGPAPVVPLQFATTGAGGVFMSARDLALWGEHVATSLEPGRRTGIVPLGADHAGSGIGRALGYRAGWFISELAGRTVFWHDGNRGGSVAVLAVVPEAGLTVAFAANRSDLSPTALVEAELLERLDDG